MVECLLCKEDARGSNPRESITDRRKPCGLYARREYDGIQTDAPDRESASGKGPMYAPVTPTGRTMTTVCKRSPGTHWTRTIPGCSGTTITDRRLLCRLMDCSARELTKDVPSCEKPQGAAWKRRTEDLRMGIPTAIASRNGERPELKHLSRDRKRKQLRCRK